MRREPNDAEIAWAAGLFEGEGSFHVGVHKAGKKGYPARFTKANLTSCDCDVVEAFAAVVGIGTVRGPYSSGKLGHRPHWQWNVSAAPDVLAVIDLFLPWLKSRRRAKALEVMEVAKAIRPYGRGLCAKRHEIVGANVMITENGTRIRCRRCHNERTLRRYHERRVSSPIGAA